MSETSEKAARAAHAAILALARQRQGDRLLCQTWDACEPCQEASREVAAAVLTADPERAALVDVARAATDLRGGMTFQKFEMLELALNRLAKVAPALLAAARGAGKSEGA